MGSESQLVSTFVALIRLSIGLIGSKRENIFTGNGNVSQTLKMNALPMQVGCHSQQRPVPKEKSRKVGLLHKLQAKILQM